MLAVVCMMLVNMLAIEECSWKFMMQIPINFKVLNSLNIKSVFIFLQIGWVGCAGSCCKKYIYIFIYMTRAHLSSRSHDCRKIECTSDSGSR